MGEFRQARARLEGPARTTKNGHHPGAVHHTEIPMAPSVSLGGKITPITSIDPHLVALFAPETFEAEPYRLLGHMMEQIRHNGGPRVIAISSPTPGDGKTITAINLAGILSQTQATRVLLVEADLRRPSVGDYLGFERFGGRGLVEAIQNASLAIEERVKRFPQFNLAVLPAGCALASPHEVLTLPQLGALLEKARQDYDYVIVDAPPLVHFADCQYIGRWVDGFLVLVAAHETPRKLLEEALNAIDPGKIIGLVFNKDEGQASRYYQYREYYTSPSRHHRERGHAHRSRRLAGLGVVVFLFLMLGMAVWRPSSLSDAIQGIIHGMQGTWQKVQKGLISSDRRPPVTHRLPGLQRPLPS